MTKFALHPFLAFSLCITCLLQPPSVAAQPALKSGIDKANFDQSVKAGDDFFQHVNGEWIKHNPIPPEYSRWGAFPKLRDDNLIALHEILEELVGTKEELNEERTKLRDFYQTAMDEAAVQKIGMSPLKPALKRIDSVQSKNDLIAEVARLRENGIATLFSFYVEQDEKQSDRYAAQISQGGMGLPDRDYYVGTSKDSKRIRDLYREHVAKMLGLLGESKEAAASGADTVLRIETRLAEKSRTPTQLRDREANYNKESLTDLATLASGFDWKLYLDTIDVRDAKYVIVGQPEFLQRMNELVGSVPLKDWQVYLRWHLVHEMAPYLSKPFEDENFRFYSQELRGVKEMQPRWKRVVAAIDGEIGEALGKIYVEKHFPPLAKKRMDELVKNLMAAYRERLEGRDWMGPKTKKLALAKLDAVFPKIGYPSKWRDYSDLKIGRDSYAANVMRAEAFESRYRFNKIGKAVDRTEWHMTPPTVNAYYNPTMNEIVFPAGILQPPFFDMAADDAVNYGGIGAVIGHEITHGFDDQGSRSDARGNLVNWWTDEDRKQFTAKTDKLVKQYDACEVLDGLHVNGELTLGENIADLGGITIAYAAYQKSLGGKAAPKIDGFTGPQRFFMGFAQVWRGSSRDAQMRLMIRTDPHSPPQFRTNVPLSNIKAFYDAFGIKPGHTMYREPSDRVEVW
jgi:putative endopeptidase